MVLLGVDEVYAMGGAGAIGALAYGVPDLGLAPVQVITGPGNLFVATAKRAVTGVVGIDSEAGPTEILVIADESASPALVVADLAGQAMASISTNPWVVFFLINLILFVLGTFMDMASTILICTPIFLPIAMAAGMAPIAAGFTADPSFRSPMAVAVIGGLITSTALSLFVVPVVYTYIDDVERFFSRMFRGRHGPAAAQREHAIVPARREPPAEPARQQPESAGQ